MYTLGSSATTTTEAGGNISFVTTAKNDEQGLALMRHFGMPFRT